MFGVFKRVAVAALAFFSSNVNSLKFVSMNNQECKIRPKIVDINSNEPVFFPYSIKTNKCSGSCSNINDLFTNLCIPDVAKNINIKVSNLMSRTNETKYIVTSETC